MKALRVMSFAIPIILAALLMIVVRPVYPFVPEATGTGPNAYTVDAWPAGAQPINWLINPTRSSAITGSTSVTTVIQAAFATWTTAPDTNLSVISSPGTSTITDANNVPNGTNLVCFVCTGVDFSASDGTLALTTTFSNGSGVISQADIYFNPNPQNNVRFVTDPQATPCSTSSPQDLQTVATHEIGHFFGLDHSGIARAIMYPFAPCILTTLSYDDLAGISTSYPSPAPVVPIGKITGTVNMAPNGSPVFAAHVFANSTTASDPFAAFNNIRKTPIGTLTLPNGSFTISGVPADSYVVMAEPLDGPVDNTAVEWGLPAKGATFNQQIQTNFTTRWH